MARSITAAAVAGFLVILVASMSVATGGLASADDPLSGLRTDEVEAGVLRVVGDGYRDLPTEGHWRVEAGLDGSVWLLSGPEAVRLEGERSITWSADEWQADLRWWSPAPEGGLHGWARNVDGEWFVASFVEPDSEPRTVQLSEGLEPYAFMPDGRAWAQRLEDDRGMTYSLWRLTDDVWSRVADVLDVGGPRVTADGQLWLGYGFFPFETPALRRFDGGDWVSFAAPKRTPNDDWTVGPDGSVWTWANYRIDYPDTAFLARMKDGVWTSWERGEVPPFADMRPGIDTIVAPDGALWVAAPVWKSSVGDIVKRCRGVTRFDSVTLTTYLEDHCVRSLSIAPDGSVWLRANEAGHQGTRSDKEPVYTYLIAPEADTDAG